jgi:hypothetical protein
MLGGVLLYECGELGAGKVVEQLIKQARDLYDWVALLLAAFGEGSRLGNIRQRHYRRALPLISDCKTCFGRE